MADNKKKTSFRPVGTGVFWLAHCLPRQTGWAAPVLDVPAYPYLHHHGSCAATSQSFAVRTPKHSPP